MVLQAAPIGEYDKRIVILTKERGKLSAFAKGARRPQSHLAGVTTPCAFGEFSLYEGRSSYTIHSADISHYFAELRTDVEAAYYGFYFLEFADYYTKEGNDEREMLKLLFQTMRALTRRRISLVLVKNIFVTKECVDIELNYTQVDKEADAKNRKPYTQNKCDPDGIDNPDRGFCYLEIPATALISYNILHSMHKNPRNRLLVITVRIYIK